jgi:2-C-methyl-D-erythritol 2,4-cyclodiphosphate synthase
MRIGIGFDVHDFTPARKLILGGIEIPSESGLAGHSDADVLLHAIIDAMLGALALGDIGQHFPDTDPKYKDISSSKLFDIAYDLIKKEGFEISNLDCSIILQRPKISHYFSQIRQKISNLLGCDINQISVKATTTEKLGFIGRNEGAAALVVVLLKKRAGY